MGSTSRSFDAMETNESNSDDEYEDEEILIHLYFSDTLGNDILNQENKEDIFFKLIGADSENPAMQLEDQVFSGKYFDIVGTALFFEDDPSWVSPDPVFCKQPARPLKYVYKTRKGLMMSRVFLKNKKGEEFRRGEGSYNSVDENLNCNSEKLIEEESTESDLDIFKNEDICQAEEIFNQALENLSVIRPENKNLAIVSKYDTITESSSSLSEIKSENEGL